MLLMLLRHVKPRLLVAECVCLHPERREIDRKTGREIGTASMSWRELCSI